MRNVTLAALFAALTLLSACASRNTDWDAAYEATSGHSADSALLDN
jgi:hypothetical protein